MSLKEVCKHIRYIVSKIEEKIAKMISEGFYANEDDAVSRLLQEIELKLNNKRINN